MASTRQGNSLLQYIGVLAGYSPRLGPVLMRVTDIVLVLPFLPLLIIGLLVWASTARVIRSQVPIMAKQDYATAAHGLGARHRHIILQHVLPQVLMLAVGEFVQVTGQAILLEASLSFLGLGDPLAKSWGTILYWTQVRGAFLSPAWVWWVLPAGLLISVSTLGFALIGFAPARAMIAMPQGGKSDHPDRLILIACWREIDQPC